MDGFGWYKPSVYRFFLWAVYHWISQILGLIAIPGVQLTEVECCDYCDSFETLVDAWIYLDLRCKPTKRVEDFPIESGDCWVVDITFLQFGGHPWGSSG